jgi:thioredoxin reductase (NADPH)
MGLHLQGPTHDHARGPARRPCLRVGAAEELARLAQTFGDVRLGAGDYAVHEGDERSLFVVLAGRIEVTKVIDGIERVIGQTRAGPDLRRGADHLRHAYQGSYRATEPSRVMNLSARQFHALTAALPTVLTQVAAIAAERIGGLRASLRRRRARAA